ncbi:MAG: isochorismatase family protein [Bacteroidetes bacterium]|nr:isochorismatase family protein [Bacteroidota bacterium]
MTTDLDANYAKAGYNTPQRWGKSPALVLVDFAKAYFEPSSPLYGGEGCITAAKNARRLLDQARSLAIPVIFTEVRYKKGGADGGVFFRKTPPLSCFEAGNPLGDLHEDLQNRDDEIIITKQYPSAFFGTSLAAMLTSMQVDTVLLTGLTTSGCVRASCVDAMSNGFITLVVSDACGDRADAPHQANLFDMGAKYADVLTTDDACAYVQSAAS